MEIRCKVCGEKLFYQCNDVLECKSCGVCYSVKDFDTKLFDTDSKSFDDLTKVITVVKKYIYADCFAEAKKLINKTFKSFPNDFNLMFYKALADGKCNISIGDDIENVIREGFVYDVNGRNGKKIKYVVLENELTMLLNEVESDKGITDSVKEERINLIGTTLFLSKCAIADYFRNRANEISDKYFNSYTEAAERACDEALFNARFECLKAAYYIYDSILPVLEKLRHNALIFKNITYIKVRICEYLQYFCDYYEVIDRKRHVELYEKLKYEIREYDPKWGTEYYQMITPFDFNQKEDYNDLKKRIVLFWEKEEKRQLEKKLMEEKQLRINKYWSEHVEEKAQLEKQKEELLIEKEKLVKHKQNLEIDGKVKELMDKYEKLKQELNSTGVFNFYKKKNIKSELKTVKKDMEINIKDRDEKHAEINGQLACIELKINQIIEIFNKDR